MLWALDWTIITPPLPPPLPSPPPPPVAAAGQFQPDGLTNTVLCSSEEQGFRH